MSAPSTSSAIRGLFIMLSITYEKPGHSCEPGAYPAAECEPFDLVIREIAMPIVSLHLIDGERARSDEAHVSLQDVDQLRKLVERSLSHQPAHLGDPGIALGRLHA